jgi:hypothetical protein
MDAPSPPSIPPPLTSRASWPSSSVVHSTSFLAEIEFGNPVGDPVEQFEAVGVGTIHYPQSERCSGRSSGSLTPAARRLRGRSRR